MPGVLITGANGFVGSACLEAASAFALPVHAVSRRAGEGRGCSWHRADLLDPEQVTDLMAAVRPTHLLHLAWVTTPGTYWTSPDNEHWRDASLQLVREFARHGGRRVLVAGTCAEYDWSAGLCAEAATATRPATPYGRSKHALHEELVPLTEEVGVQLVWARLFFLYGPREDPARLVPSVIGALLRSQPALCSFGTQRRDFLHVSDAAEALLGLLFAGAAGTFNVASGLAVSVAEVVNRIGDLLGMRDRIRLGARPVVLSDPPLLVADVRRLGSALGWAPRLGLTEGLEQTIAWWRRDLCVI